MFGYYYREVYGVVYNGSKVLEENIDVSVVYKLTGTWIVFIVAVIVKEIKFVMYILWTL